MELKRIEHDFSVCKIEDFSLVNLDAPYCFIGKTDEERSLVCLTQDVPANTIKRDDGWKAFRIQGTLDFSLIGILSKISGILADQSIGIFAVSTYNTDYVLTKAENYEKALHTLSKQDTPSFDRIRPAFPPAFVSHILQFFSIIMIPKQVNRRCHSPSLHKNYN